MDKPFGHITPTVGRVVYYKQWKAQTEPNAALVAAVNLDGTLNLAVSNYTGNICGIQNVLLIQDGEELPEKGAFCYWMPYQVGQAKKESNEQVKQDVLSGKPIDWEDPVTGTPQGG